MRIYSFFRHVPMRSFLLLGMTVAVGATDHRALAQRPVAAPPATAGPASATNPPPGSSPSASPVPGVAGGTGGGRIGAAEVPIVGGNVASARERALTEALKQAVDQALGVMVPDAHAAQPKVVAQVLGRARGYVRRYRTVEEGEKGRGLYGVRIEAEVDEGALQRAFDKSSASGTGGAAVSATAVGTSYLLVGAGVPEAIAAVGRAFVAAGARVQPAGADLLEPGKAVAAAARAGIAAVAFVSGSAMADGKVRGPGVESVTCSVGVRVLSAGKESPAVDESETVRSFAAEVDRARAGCFERAAAAVVPRVVPAPGRSPPDMRSIVLEADVVEPGAVPALVKQLRGIGSVSAIEVRRIAAGRVELWVRSRLPGSALAAALARDPGGALAVTVGEVTGDLVRVQIRLRELVPASTAPAQVPSPPATTVPNPNARPTP